MSDIDISVRLADANDLPGLHAVIERAYRGDSARGGWTHEADLVEGQRIEAEALVAVISDPEARLLVAEADDLIIGCVQVNDRGDGLAYLGLLCVDPTLQDSGIGRLLLEEAEALAAATFRARAIEMTVIDRRVELIAYYERRGYLPTGERRDFPIPLDPPLHMTVLEKAL